ncbi:MAG: heparin lyase I family protein [Chitinophagaceae bacterium]
MNRPLTSMLYRKIVWLFLLCSTMAAAQRQHLLFESSFEGNGAVWLSGFVNNQHAHTYSLTQTQAAARTGASALRLEVRNTDTQVSSSIRSELTMQNVTDSGERWYGISYYFTDWIPDASPHHITQWHPNSSGGSAVLALNAQAGVFQLIHRVADPTYGYIYKYIENPLLGSPVSNVWTDFVFHVKWDSTANGYIQIWKNGVLVYDTSGLRTEWGGQYLKAGINHYGWSIPYVDEVTERIYYIDDLRIGDGDATYADVAPSPPQRNNLLFESSFEGGNDYYLTGFENYQHCCSYSVARTEAAARSGASALRLEVRDDDELVSGSIRSELTVPAVSDAGEMWYGFSFYLTDWIADGSPHSILQWQPNSNSGGPPISLQTHDGAFMIVHGEDNVGYHYETNGLLGSPVSDEWTDFVFHIKWSSATDGYIQVWKNGVLVYDTSGIRTQWGDGQYLKLGINHWGWAIEMFDVATERILYVDDVRIGNADATYDDVAPGGVSGCLQPRATLAATETCEGGPYYLVLSDAEGTGPFDLEINNSVYTHVAEGDSILLVSPAEETIWNSTPTPNNFTDASVELGVKFMSSKPGLVKGIRFFSHTSPTGTYTGHLWTAGGSLLASATFSSVTGSSWQQVLFSTPVEIDANTVYVASYHTTGDKYVATPYGLALGLTRGSLTALADGAEGGNGLYVYSGTPAFPTNTYSAGNYWVDVVFTASINDTFRLLSVTDAGGCTRTGDLQVVTVESGTCSFARMAARPVLEEEPAPVSNRLEQNYPNPFHGGTTIRYSLAEKQQVNLSLFDMHGRLLKVLVSGTRDAGTHTVPLAAGRLSSGVYYYRIQAGKFTEVKKMVIQ